MVKRMLGSSASHNEYMIGSEIFPSVRGAFE